MAVAAAQVHVHDQSALDSTITSYIAQGFTVQNRGEDFAVMFKKKEFNVLWAIVGFCLCLLPLLIYAVVYSTQRDQLVEIRIVQRAGEVQWSEDRQYWWDGTAWTHVDTALPPKIQISPDGHHFWDGATWRSMRATSEPAGLAAAGSDAQTGDAPTQQPAGGAAPTQEGSS